MVCDRPLTLALLLAVILFTTISPVSASDSPGSNPVSAADSYSAQGTLNIVYGDGPEGFSNVKYYLYGDDGTRIRLSFASPPSFAYFGKQVLVPGAPPARALVQTGQAEKYAYAVLGAGRQSPQPPMTRQSSDTRARSRLEMLI